jgi:predicted O-methyltransferase YrrM
MSAVNVSDPAFSRAVKRLRVPEMGTETVAPLLALLVRLVRPRRVLEVGMGYTTPFLAAALAEVEEQVRAESATLADKTRARLAAGGALDEGWLTADPALAAPAFFVEPYRPRFVAVDNLSIADSSAVRVGPVLAELGLADRVTVVDADLRSCRDQLPEDLFPIDLAWVDAWECLYFFDTFWELMSPDGGLLVMHYLMTYPEGEAILRYIAKVQQARPGELELVNLLEPHKLTQNSLTIVRRTSDVPQRRWSGTGGRFRYDDEALLAAAVTQAGVAPPG